VAIETRAVESREDAEQLGDLVYSTYGLTYHRSFLYDADRVLELSAEGALHSMIAVDGDTGEVVGHQALIRPWFENADPLAPGRGAAVLEDGLSIVRPDQRGRGVQNTLAMALLMHIQPRNPDLRGVYIKCVTTSVASQRSTRHFLGRASALFLAGVPAWVVMDGDKGPKEPLTTILVHCVVGDRHPARVPVPARHAELLGQLYREMGLPRELDPIAAGASGSGEARVSTWFDPARRQGVVRLLEPGADLVELLDERVRWMIGGHIEHVTVLLPLATPGAAAAVPALEERGLFFGGVIPDLEGHDTLVLERISATELDTDRIQVVGAEAELLKGYVVEQWRRSQGA
jgi:hypothetical protein